MTTTQHPPDLEGETIDAALKHARQALTEDQAYLDRHPPILTLALAVLALQQRHDQLVGPTTYCTGCGNEIDPEVCHCGDLIEGHGYGVGGHGAVPMGCTCGYGQADDFVRLSKTLRERWRESRAQVERDQRELAQLRGDLAAERAQVAELKKRIAEFSTTAGGFKP